MEELEEGREARIDFAKLRRVGEAGYEVVPVVLQDADDGAVLYVGYANELALRETLRTRPRGALVDVARRALAEGRDLGRRARARRRARQLRAELAALPGAPARARASATRGIPRAASAAPGCYYRRVLRTATLEFV